MMISRQELNEYLTELLEPENFSDYCDNGLQVEGEEQVHKIGTAVTASEAAIDAAIAKGCDALVVHHGLFWDRQRTRLVGGMRRRVAKLLGQGINLFAYHLPLDGHSEVGNNWRAARDLGLSDLSAFADIGVVGSMAPAKVTEWVKQLEDYFSASAHVALGGPDNVARVAILSGGGHRYLAEALAAEVDCYVTGTFDEPIWHQAHEEGIHFVALGHSATERVGVRALADHLAKRFEIDAEFLDLHNPF